MTRDRAVVPRDIVVVVVVVIIVEVVVIIVDWLLCTQRENPGGGWERERDIGTTWW